VVLTPTRWKLRRAVALLNRIFTTLGLEKDPNKTFIGRVEKGFDFLGYHLWPDRITVAQATVERFLARVTRLYEQGQGRPGGSAPRGLSRRVWPRSGRASSTHARVKAGEWGHRLRLAANLAASAAVPAAPAVRRGV